MILVDLIWEFVQSLIKFCTLRFWYSRAVFFVQLNVKFCNCHCYYLKLSLFACRDDPELDTMLKKRLRWGDPMAHLVKVTSVFDLELFN